MHRTIPHKVQAYSRGLKGAAIFAVGLSLAIAGGAMTFHVLDKAYPPTFDRMADRSFDLLDRNGDSLHRFLTSNDLLRLPVNYGDVDPNYIKLLVAYEDKRFWDHGGVDYLALARATGQLIRHRKIISGGSTLTMQTARLLEPKPRTVKNKLIEIFRAWQLERRLSKIQILEIYFTLAPYGGNIEGVRAASLTYFGREAKRLTADEAALLVALPKSPNMLRPDHNPLAARKARNIVLKRVGARTAYSTAALKLALTAKVPQKRLQPGNIAPHLAQRLKTADKTSRRYNSAIDPMLQSDILRLAQQAAKDGGPKVTSAVLVASLKTRQVRAYIGNAFPTDRDRDGYVDMVPALRSPGSTLKPIIYGMAFERGLAHPDSLIRDRPKRFGAYAPQNFQDKHYGRVSLAEALRRSLNVPAVSVLQRLGPVRFRAQLTNAGMTLALPDGGRPGLALALGGVGSSLEDLTALFAALGSDGHLQPLCFDATVKNCPKKKNNKIIDAQARLQIAAILMETQPPEGLLPRRYQSNPRGIAYKTGTSYGFRDAWAIGFDGGHVVAVWTGRADGTPVPGRFGANAAAPLLFKVFELLDKKDIDLNGLEKRQTADLPPVLKYFDKADRDLVLSFNDDPPPHITYPANATQIALARPNERITINVEGGKRPLFLYQNNVPMAEQRWSRDFSFVPKDQGYHTLTIMDARGLKTTARIKVLFEHQKD